MSAQLRLLYCDLYCKKYKCNIFLDWLQAVDLTVLKQTNRKINIIYPGANGPNESPAAGSVCSPVADLRHAVHKLFQIQSRILRAADIQRLENICHSALWGSACLLLGLIGNAVSYARLLGPCCWRHEDHMRQEIETHLLFEGFFSEEAKWIDEKMVWTYG